MHVGLCSNRGPQAMRSHVLEPRELYALRAGEHNEVLALKWQSTKVVSLLSTMHSKDLVETRKGLKPVALVDYNRYMGGVDRQDQVIASSFFLLNLK